MNSSEKVHNPLYYTIKQQSIVFLLWINVQFPLVLLVIYAFETDITLVVMKLMHMKGERNLLEENPKTFMALLSSGEKGVIENCNQSFTNVRSRLT